MAIADGALLGYETLDDLQRQEIPAGENEIPLRFNKSALNQLILRKCTKARGETDEPMPRSAFVNISVALSKMLVTSARRQSTQSVASLVRRSMNGTLKCRGRSISRKAIPAYLGRVTWPTLHPLTVKPPFSEKGLTAATLTTFKG
jgi:hypothetical protein